MEATQVIEAIDTALRANSDELWDRGCHSSIIDSCEENVRDDGLSEDDDRDAFWSEVLLMLASELDSFGVEVDTRTGSIIIRA